MVVLRRNLTLPFCEIKVKFHRISIIMDKDKVAGGIMVIHSEAGGVQEGVVDL